MILFSDMDESCCSCSEVLGSLGENSAIAVMEPHWHESMREFSAHAADFLKSENLRLYSRFCGLSHGAEQKTIKTARKILDNPALTRLAWHCHRLLFAHKDYDAFGKWPELKHSLGDDSGAFYLVCALSMVPLVREAHRSIGIPEEITSQTCSQIRCFCSNFELSRGEYGIFTRQLSWLRNYVEGRLFMLGRFEYMLKPFASDIVVFRNKFTGRAAALMEAGVGITEEGYIDSQGADSR